MTRMLILQNYEMKLEKLKCTFSPQQNELFDEWFEVALLLNSFAIVENRTVGFQEGLNTAADLARDGNPKALMEEHY